MKIISAEDAAQFIQDEWCVVAGGFGSCGHPDSLTRALRERFIATGYPRRLKLLFAAGPGDKCGRGLDTLALNGLVAQAIGGFWGLNPALTAMARRGAIEAHNWPQGVISKLFSVIASGSPGVISRVGIDTFVDPKIDGGVIDTGNSKPLVERVSLRGIDYLFYPAQTVNCALLRGTAADADGNISFQEETSYMDALAQALAAKNSGGTVIVQIKRLLDRQDLKPSEVRIPGFLVDYVVLAKEDEHPQTYGKNFDASYTSRTEKPKLMTLAELPLAKRIIAERAALELKKHPGANVNLGIGIPALIGPCAQSLGINNFTLTVESGLVGGVPDEGLSFGAAMNPQAVIEQAALFDFYDGGGLDVAFLGFGEIDTYGNVNVSKLGERVPGSGGFINISQATKKIVFCGTLTANGLEVALQAGKLVVRCEGKVTKFLPQVAHLTFNASAATAAEHEVLYITERAVFSLQGGRLMLQEIAPGIDVESLRNVVACDFNVASELTLMPNFAQRSSAYVET